MPQPLKSQAVRGKGAADAADLWAGSSIDINSSSERRVVSTSGQGRRAPRTSPALSYKCCFPGSLWDPDSVESGSLVCTADAAGSEAVSGRHLRITRISDRFFFFFVVLFCFLITRAWSAPLGLHVVYFPIHCSDYLRSAEMTEVMMNAPSMEEIGLSPRKDGLSYQIFPDPSDFDRCCKLKDRLPSIVVEPTEGEVESGELRWPPEEFLVQEDEQDNCEETTKEKKDQ
eukprot:XP_008762755.1 PREDICTED: protein LBH isoform X1 [Rattus norvegicus]